MRSPPIEVRELTVQLNGQRVLDRVDLTIEAGDFVGLVGPNGSGKTTLLRTALGLQRATSGRAFLFGAPARRFREHARLGYVPQHAVHVDPKFPASAFEVALLGRVGKRKLLRPLNAEDRQVTRDALERVGVAHLAERPIGNMSGGQRQRVFLAQALASDPELLILDEPTTGVDSAAREEFYNLIDSLNHEHGMTIVLVSHDLPALERVVHRLVAINQRVLYDGPPAAFEEAGGLSDAFGMHIHHGGEDCDHPV